MGGGGEGGAGGDEGKSGGKLQPTADMSSGKSNGLDVDDTATKQTGVAGGGIIMSNSAI